MHHISWLCLYVYVCVRALLEALDPAPCMNYLMALLLYTEQSTCAREQFLFISAGKLLGVVDSLYAITMQYGTMQTRNHTKTDDLFLPSSHKVTMFTRATKYGSQFSIYAFTHSGHSFAFGLPSFCYRYSGYMLSTKVKRNSYSYCLCEMKWKEMHSVRRCSR